jgi:hypothetical protein
MQKLSAFKNCSSDSQFLFSTISRCINAICAAGPPNESNPILHHIGVLCFNDGLVGILKLTLKPSRKINHLWHTMLLL